MHIQGKSFFSLNTTTVLCIWVAGPRTGDLLHHRVIYRVLRDYTVSLTSTLLIIDLCCVEPSMSMNILPYSLIVLPIKRRLPRDNHETDSILPPYAYILRHLLLLLLQQDISCIYDSIIFESACWSINHTHIHTQRRNKLSTVAEQSAPGPGGYQFQSRRRTF